MKKSDELATQVATLLHTRRTALTFDEIAEALAVTGNAKKKLQKSLHSLIQNGDIVRIRDNRYAVGAEADLVTGTLKILRSGHGIVLNEGKTVFVPAPETATALPGDRVVVRLTSDGRQDRPDMRNGTVIRILERARHEIVGTLRAIGKFLCVVPVDPSYARDIYVQDAAGAKINDRVLIRFTQWENRHVNPEGVVLETLGPADDPSTDTISIIKHYGLPESFAPEVLQEAESVSALMDRPGPRLDLRQQVIFTIDPLRARDFDDALSLEPTADGATELGVHIADVSHFVRVGSPLDREAAERGTSVYLPDKVLPMLPEQLSNGICSLRPNEDRLAFSVFMTLSADGQVTSSRFAKSIIRSRARLTYEQAMAVIDGRDEPAAPPEVRTRIKGLHRWAQLLRQNRFARHALDLDMPECEIVMGPGERVVDIRVSSSDPSHQLVEECMVAANEAVARELSERGYALISRLHAPPKPEKIEELQLQLQQMGYEPGDLTKPRNMARFLRSVADDPLVLTIRMAVLRSLNRALYSAEEGGHYGLAKTYYAHFTSPIRRYPDLLVHRQLEALLDRRGAGRKAAYSVADLVPLAEACSMREQLADEAERALEEIKKYRYLEQQIKDGKPQPLEAVVVSVTNFGLFIEAVTLQIQGLVHISHLFDGFVQHDRSLGTLRAGKTVYRVGSRVEVRALRVDFDKRQVDFVLTEGGATKAAPRSERAPGKGSRPGAGRGAGGAGRPEGGKTAAAPASDGPPRRSRRNRGGGRRGRSGKGR